MKGRKKRGPSIQYRVEQAILDKKTFSIHIGNEQGFKLVAELITYYLLRDCDERTRLLLFADLLPKVKNALPAAIKSLEKQGHAVRRVGKQGNNGGGRLWWITLKENYRNSVERDTDRSIKRLKSSIICTTKHLELSNPKALPNAKQMTQKLLMAR